MSRRSTAEVPVRGGLVQIERGTPAHESALAPRPPLAVLAAWTYAATGVVVACIEVVARTAGRGTWTATPTALLLGVAFYCAGLAYGAGRLRVRSTTPRTSVWVVLPVALHALVGLSGGVSLLLASNGLFLGEFGVASARAALYAMVFGLLPALFPALGARRAGLLVAAAVAGPLILFVVAPLVDS